MTSEQVKRRVLKDDERLQPLGSPRVVVDQKPGETRVFVDRPVWGLPHADKVFLGNSSITALAYAEQLFANLAERADKRTDYRRGRKARNAAGREISRLLNRGEDER